MRRIVYVGSFDPAHLGHLNTYRNIQRHFENEKVAVAICKSDLKQNGLFSLDERRVIAEDLFKSEVLIAKGPEEICEIIRHADIIARGIKDDGDIRYIEKLMNYYKLEDSKGKLFCVRISDEFMGYSSSNIKMLMKKDENRAKEMLSPLAFKMMKKKPQVDN